MWKLCVERLYNHTNAKSVFMRIYLFLIITIHPSNGGVKTPMDKLYETVFTNYSSKALPLLDHRKTVTVKLTAYAININEFDEMSGELSITMAFTFNWQEQRISWNRTEHNNIASIPVSPADIWRPQVYLLQSSESVDDIADNAVQARLHSDGRVHWTAGKVIKVVCSVDVKYFPFDTQSCEIILLNWVLTDSELKLLPFKGDVQIPHLSHNSQWEMRPSALRRCKSPSFDGIPCISLRFVLKRRSSFFVRYILIPLILLGLINNIVFIMPASSGERTSVAITIFLSFVVYMDTVHDVVPQSSQPMSYIYTYILYLLIYSCFSLFLCVISLRIYNKEEDIPKLVESIIWYARFRFLRLKIAKKGHSRLADSAVSPGSFSAGVYALDDFGRQHSDAIKELKAKIDGQNSTTTTQRDQVEDKDKEMKFQVTWEIVGKTFDFYCCVILSLISGAISVNTYHNLWHNKGFNH